MSETSCKNHFNQRSKGVLIFVSLIIFLMGCYLRMQTPNFAGEWIQRDLYRSDHIFDFNKTIFYGPEMEAGGHLPGPFFYLVLKPFQKVFGKGSRGIRNIVLCTKALGILSLLLFILYFYWKKQYYELFIFSTLSSINSLQLQSISHAINPSFTFLFSSLFILLFYQFIQTKKNAYYYLAVLILCLTIQIHMSYTMYFLPVLYFGFFKPNNKERRIFRAVISLLIFLFSLSPFLFFQLKYHYPDASVGNVIQNLSMGEILNSHKFYNFLHPFVILGLSFISLFVLYKKIEIKRRNTFVLALILLLLLGSQFQFSYSIYIFFKDTIGVTLAFLKKSLVGGHYSEYLFEIKREEWKPFASHMLIIRNLNIIILLLSVVLIIPTFLKKNKSFFKTFFFIMFFPGVFISHWSYHHIWYCYYLLLPLLLFFTNEISTTLRQWSSQRRMVIIGVYTTLFFTLSYNHLVFYQGLKVLDCRQGVPNRFSLYSEKIASDIANILNLEGRISSEEFRYRTFFLNPTRFNLSDYYYTKHLNEEHLAPNYSRDIKKFLYSPQAPCLISELKNIERLKKKKNIIRKNALLQNIQIINKKETQNLQLIYYRPLTSPFCYSNTRQQWVWSEEDRQLRKKYFSPKVGERIFKLQSSQTFYTHFWEEIDDEQCWLNGVLISSQYNPSWIRWSKAMEKGSNKRVLNNIILKFGETQYPFFEGDINVRGSRLDITGSPFLFRKKCPKIEYNNASLNFVFKEGVEGHSLGKFQVERDL